MLRRKAISKSKPYIQPKWKLKRSWKKFLDKVLKM